ncbi:hypothetical protein ACKLTP_18505, partial [Paenarthrobacter ureafaciens]
PLKTRVNVDISFLTIRGSGHGFTSSSRVVSAGITAWNGRPELNALTVSTLEPLPESAARILRGHGVLMVVENSAGWASRVKLYASKTGQESGVRIRLIGGPSLETAEAANGKPDIAIYANNVVAAGRVELLTFLQEQAISITAHRFEGVIADLPYRFHIGGAMDRAKFDVGG